MLDDRFNAGVVEHPSLGLLGGYRSYLILGLPLMQSLDLSSFRAVLAHEFGHMRSKHSRFVGLIYRVSHTWERTLEHLSGGGRMAQWLRGFFTVYAPRLHAHAFVLRRQDEYVADRIAAALCGSEAMVQALYKVELLGLQDAFRWQQLRPSVLKQADPPQDVFGSYRSGLRQEEQQLFLEQVLQQKTGYADTHPCLRDRVSALGHLAHLGLPQLGLEEPKQSSTAELLLGSKHASLLDQLNRRWFERVRPLWNREYQDLQEERQRLLTLGHKMQAGLRLSSDDALERVRLLEQFEGENHALEALNPLWQADPHNPRLTYHRGRLLLALDQAEGVEVLERLYSRHLEAPWTSAILHSLQAYFRKQGDAPQIERLEQAMVQHHDTCMAAEQERQQVTRSDHFEPHQVQVQSVQALRRILMQLGPLRKAYLVRKTLAHRSHEPFYVLLLVLERPFIGKIDQVEVNSHLCSLLEERSNPLSGPICILYEHPHTAAPVTRARIKRVSAACIYTA